MTLDRVNTQGLDAVTRMAQRVKAVEEEVSPATMARAQLSRAMQDARKQGFTLEQIGNAAGISKQRVSQLLQKEEK